MKGFITNIEKDSLANENFRKVLYTAKNCQVVLMSLNPGEEIGAEVHHLDQFIRIEKGQGKAILDDAEHALSDGFVIVVPSGAMHNIINTGQDSMKLYTVYAPPNHKDKTVHVTRADAEKDEGEHFDGTTSE